MRISHLLACTALLLASCVSTKKYGRNVVEPFETIDRVDRSFGKFLGQSDPPKQRPSSDAFDR